MGISLTTVRSLGVRLAAHLRGAAQVRPVEEVCEVDAARPSEIPAGQSAGVARFARTAVVTAALEERLGVDRSPSPLASARMGVEEFELLGDVKNPFSPAQLDELLAVLFRISPTTNRGHFTDIESFAYAKLSGEERESLRHLLKILKEYIEEILEKAQQKMNGEDVHGVFPLIHWTDGSRAVDDGAKEIHEDVGYATATVSLAGSGTVVRLGEEEIAAPTLVPLLITAQQRRWSLKIPATRHRSPDFEPGKPRVVLIFQFLRN